MTLEGSIVTALVALGASVITVLIASVGWGIWFGKLITRVENLQNGVKTLRSDVTELQTDATRLKAMMDYLNPAVSKLESSVTELQTDVTRLKTASELGDD